MGHCAGIINVRYSHTSLDESFCRRSASWTLIGGRRRLLGVQRGWMFPGEHGGWGGEIRREHNYATMETAEEWGWRNGCDSPVSLGRPCATVEIQFAASSMTHCHRPTGGLRSGIPASTAACRDLLQMPTKPHNDPRSRSAGAKADLDIVTRGHMHRLHKPRGRMQPASIFSWGGVEFPSWTMK